MGPKGDEGVQESEDHASAAAAALVAPATLSGTLLRIGFIPLVDCAPLIVAHEKGFAAAEGLRLDLVRETSWANIRDRVALGHFDAAHMLAPMTIAATLGLGHLKAPMVTPFVLNLGGNAIAITTALADAIPGGPGERPLHDPLAAARAFAQAVRTRAKAGAAAPALAMVYPFSGQNYELRYWLAAGGLDPDRDVRMVVVPPPFMVDAMKTGQVDGICVGAPWPSLAVDTGLGAIVGVKSEIWPYAPEKVVGMREAWAERHPSELAALIRALDRAAAWCDDRDNAAELAEMLGRAHYLDVAADVIARSLTHALVTDTGAPAVPVPDYILFHGHGANRPETADALWFASQMQRWGQVTDDPEAVFAAARRSVRPDLYDAALGRGGTARAAGPVAAKGGFALFDGIPFDPADPLGYLARHAVRAAAPGAEPAD
ncbi:hypothetical protein C2U72_09800 [Prosthecomicrobium hirschii]|nr:hypothetical protein C2U72_09800 [Prosthecomicrobium hirschii]